MADSLLTIFNLSGTALFLILSNFEIEHYGTIKIHLNKETENQQQV